MRGRQGPGLRGRGEAARGRRAAPRRSTFREGAYPRGGRLRGDRRGVLDDLPRVASSRAAGPGVAAMAESAPAEGLWTPLEVAAYLRVSRSWVYQKAEAG